jgi:hypothetical protein
MSKKLCSLIFCGVVLAVMAGSALAADVVWTNAGTDGLWTNPGNWSGGVPTLATSDKAKVVKLAPDDAHINAGMTAECTWLVIGDNVSGGVHMTGGAFNISGAGDSWSIIAYGPSDVGVFTMDGGTVTTNNRFYVGFQGNGTVNMNGGTMNIGGTFGIGYGEGFTTARGYVYLNGGTINVTSTSGTNLNMSSPAGCLGKLDISGGTLVLTGDRRTLITGYVNSGYIVAFNGLGDVVATFDGVNTTVTGATNPYKARGPKPASNVLDAPPYTVLSWTPGTGALTHDVYFGTDANSVRDANTVNTLGVYVGPQDLNSFTPTGLELSHAYYWRIDEVNNTNVFKGDSWQFVVASFALIDDFEKYADTTDMSASWSNGSTGATLSLAATGGHDKAKTMKFDYDNSGGLNYSEAQTASPTINWTVEGVVAVDIWYKGNAGNADEPMYAALEDNNGHSVAILVNSTPAAAQGAEWQVWHIKLSDFTGVNLANVKKFYIGFGNRTTPVTGGAGTVYFDDIKLYRSRCLTPPAVDLNGDCVVDFKDFSVMANNWMEESTI